MVFEVTRRHIAISSSGGSTCPFGIFWMKEWHSFLFCFRFIFFFFRKALASVTHRSTRGFLNCIFKRTDNR